METMKMSELTKALNEIGVKAIFAMSGGNCGTIYIGETDSEGYYEFAIGPGNYSEDKIHYQEICWGKDGSEDATYYIQGADDFTPEKMAELIACDYFNQTAFACGSCGGKFSALDGIVGLNAGFVEFTCTTCIAGA